MTYVELARMYIEGDGIGEATCLVHFDYRKGKTHVELGHAITKAEHNIRKHNLEGAALLTEVAVQLGRVLKPKRHPRKA